MANVAPVLLLASAAPAAGGDGEEEDPSGQRRADRWAGAGDAAALVCGGRGRREGKHALCHFERSLDTTKIKSHQFYCYY